MCTGRRGMEMGSGPSLSGMSGGGGPSKPSGPSDEIRPESTSAVRIPLGDGPDGLRAPPISAPGYRLPGNPLVPLGMPLVTIPPRGVKRELPLPLPLKLALKLAREEAETAGPIRGVIPHSSRAVALPRPPLSRRAWTACRGTRGLRGGGGTVETTGGGGALSGGRGRLRGGTPSRPPSVDVRPCPRGWDWLTPTGAVCSRVVAAREAGTEGRAEGRVEGRAEGVMEVGKLLSARSRALAAATASSAAAERILSRSSP